MSTGSDPQGGSAGDTPLVRCTVAEAAGRLGISKRAVMRQIQKGTLAAERSSGQWVVMLPSAPDSAEGELASNEIASGSPNAQSAGPPAGGRFVGPNALRQGRPQDQIDQAIERLGEQHSIRLRALSEQIRQHASSPTTKPASAQIHAGPFERQLEMPAQSGAVSPEQRASTAAPPAVSSQPEASAAPHEPPRAEALQAAPSAAAEQQWEAFFKSSPIVPSHSDSPPVAPQTGRITYDRPAPLAVTTYRPGWRERAGDWWQNLISRYAYRSRLIFAMIGVALLLGALLGCVILLLYVPSRGQANRVILAATVSLPAGVATGAAQVQATASATSAAIGTSGRAGTSVAPTEAAPNLAATAAPDLATNAPAATSASGSGAAGDMLRRVAAAEAALRQGLVVAIISNADGTGAWAQTRFDLGDATRPPALHITSIYTGTSGIQRIERITIGTRSWERSPDGHWSARPAHEGIADQVRVFLPQPPSNTNTNLEQNSTMALLSWHESSRGADITLAVDPATGTPRQLRQATPATGTVQVVTYSQWNMPVDITPPTED